jgi:excisionase family DNA binding protein
MVRKFIDLDEAAKMLGIAPETLNEMRERQKIYGYRDGGSWKFKPEDVEKLIADRDASDDEGEFAELDEDPDSILLSEVELGQSDESTSSTIIGGKPSRNPSESDITLARPKHDSDIDLDAPIIGDPTSGSDVLASDSAIVKGGSSVSPLFDELDTLDLEMDSAADSGISTKEPGSGVAGGLSGLELSAPSGGSDIELSSDAMKLEGSNLAFGGDDLSLGEGSGINLQEAVSGGSAIDLAGDEDGDLVLGGSSHGDLSRAGDSGISLLDPADSGLSLESAPLALGGSAVESLELGEDDLLVEDTPAAKSAPAAKAPGGKAPVAPQESDDDFLLTPLEEGAAEESDSGSQVIALEGDVEFEEASPGASAALGEMPAEVGGGGLLEEDLGEGLGGGGLSSGGLSVAAMSPAAVPATQAGPAVTGGYAAAPEATFSGYNVISLALCSVMLLFVGMFTFDMLRNMWSWNEAYSVNNSMMDAILSWFEK